MDMSKTVITASVLFCFGCRSIPEKEVFDNSHELQQITITETIEIPVFGDEKLYIDKNINIMIFCREISDIRYEILTRFGGRSFSNGKDKYLDETDDIRVSTKSLLSAIRKHAKKGKETINPDDCREFAQKIYIFYDPVKDVWLDKVYKSNPYVNIDPFWSDLKKISEREGGPYRDKRENAGGERALK